MRKATHHGWPAKMKFGHNLPRNQVPEWASSYINYKGLKKLIKNAAEASKHGSDPDLAGQSKPNLLSGPCRFPNTTLLTAARRILLFS